MQVINVQVNENVTSVPVVVELVGWAVQRFKVEANASYTDPQRKFHIYCVLGLNPETVDVHVWDTEGKTWFGTLNVKSGHTVSQCKSKLRLSQLVNQRRGKSVAGNVYKLWLANKFK